MYRPFGEMRCGSKLTGRPWGTGSRWTAQLTTVGDGGDDTGGDDTGGDDASEPAAGEGRAARTGFRCDRSAYGPAAASPTAATRATAPDAAAARRQITRRRPV